MEYILRADHEQAIQTRQDDQRVCRTEGRPNREAGKTLLYTLCFPAASRFQHPTRPNVWQASSVVRDFWARWKIILNGCKTWSDSSHMNEPSISVSAIQALST